MRQILYFHGLDGHLTTEKRVALEKYGSVIADTIDYRSSENIFFELLSHYRNYKPDVIIGNSLGGLVAYWLSLDYGTPALLFNPVLDYQRFTNKPLGIERYEERTHLLQVVIGKKDTIVSPQDTLNYLDRFEKKRPNIHCYDELDHFIPLQPFSYELNAFFEAIDQP